MSRRRLMVGKEYKYIKDVNDLYILTGTTNAGHLFNNNNTSTNDMFEVHFTFRVDANDATYGFITNYYSSSAYWDVAVRNGYLEYRECFDGNVLTINFSPLGKIEKNKWYTVDLRLSKNCNLTISAYGKCVDMRGEIILKGFSSDHTQNIGVWNIDHMSLGTGEYMNGSGGTPSSLRLSVMSSSVCLGRE